jgi:hypothetical protein
MKQKKVDAIMEPLIRYMGLRKDEEARRLVVELEDANVGLAAAVAEVRDLAKKYSDGSAEDKS